ncbi:hypothetical protein ACFWWC_00015 [Streptomyces sp. NPDC058642]
MSLDADMALLFTRRCASVPSATASFVAEELLCEVVGNMTGNAQ